jgi:hypothetical protein
MNIHVPTQFTTAYRFDDHYFEFFYFELEPFNQ